VSEVVMMLLMPFLLQRMTVRKILIVGMLSWTIRYVLLAYGNAGALMWMFYIAILLHGVCYDFFFVTGQLYTDQEAPPNLRSAAQGLITFLTYGVGMFVGSLSSGVAIDHFTHTVAGVAVRNWQSFWLTSAGSAFIVLLLIVLFFRSHSRIKSQEPA
jgi:MFS family permease